MFSGELKKQSHWTNVFFNNCSVRKRMKHMENER